MDPSQEVHNDRPATPPRPPYSPVTPVFSHAALPHQNNYHYATNHTPSPMILPASPTSPTSQIPPPQTPPTFEPQPPPVPISESQNPDAIALRSAISILQLQKQQSLRDIQTLEKMKSAAATDPEGFARELTAGNLGIEEREEREHHFNLSPGSEGVSGPGSEEGSHTRGDGFGKVPLPQNVVRMPPVNWAKYQVIGEPLDKLHEEERRRPSAGKPRRDEAEQRPPEHVLASPYRPLVDRLETPKRDSGANSRGRET